VRVTVLSLRAHPLLSKHDHCFPTPQTSPPNADERSHISMSARRQLWQKLCNGLRRSEPTHSNRVWLFVDSEPGFVFWSPMMAGLWWCSLLLRFPRLLRGHSVRIGAPQFVAQRPGRSDGARRHSTGRRRTPAHGPYQARCAACSLRLPSRRPRQVGGFHGLAKFDADQRHAADALDDDGVPVYHSRHELHRMHME